MKTSRRNFLKMSVGAAAVIGATASLPDKDLYAADKREFSPDATGMLYDSTKCIGCQACVASCYDINFAERKKYIDKVIPFADQSFIEREDLIPKLAPEDQFNPERPWLNVEVNDYRFRNVIQKYIDTDNNTHFIKHQCMHCNHPECVSVCPVAALTKNPVDGVVEYDANICIGCRYCQIACPFYIPKFEWKRAIPKIVKCDLCKSTLTANNIYGTGCTNVCPTGAVIYGKRVDLMADAKQRVFTNPGKYFKNKVYGEFENGGTDVLYLASVDYKHLGFDERIESRSFAENSENLIHTIYKWGIAPAGLFIALVTVIKSNVKKHKNHESNDENKEKYMIIDENKDENRNENREEDN